MNVSPDGTIGTNLSPWTRLSPLDAVTPIAASRLNVDYCDEVIRTALWSDGRADQHRRVFLQIVRASELSSLTNAPGVEFINFIKQVLD